MSYKPTKSSFTRCLADALAPTNPIDDRLRLRRFAKFVLAVSVFFWCWAAYNTSNMAKGKDMGIISFFGSGLSSAYLLSKWGGAPSRIARLLVLASHLIVAANYVVGTLFAFTAGKGKVYVYFGTYCVSFTGLWLVIAYSGWKLVTNEILNASDMVTEEDEEDEDLYDFSSSGYGRGSDGTNERYSASYPYA